MEMRVRELESELGIIVRRRCQAKGKVSWQAEEQGALCISWSYCVWHWNT